MGLAVLEPLMFEGSLWFSQTLVKRIQLQLRQIRWECKAPEWPSVSLAVICVQKPRRVAQNKADRC